MDTTVGIAIIVGCTVLFGLLGLILVVLYLSFSSIRKNLFDQNQVTSIGTSYGQNWDRTGGPMPHKSGIPLFFHASWHKGSLLDVSVWASQSLGQSTKILTDHSSNNLNQFVREGKTWVIELRRENGLDRFGKLLTINREVQTSEPEFDSQVYIETEAPDHVVQGALIDPKIRELVWMILDRGCDRVRIYPNYGVVASWDRPSVEELSPNRLQAVVDSLIDLEKKLPEMDSPKKRQPILTKRKVFVTLSFLSIGLAIAYFFIAKWVWPPTEWSAFGMGAIAGFGAFVLSAPFLLFLIRGHSDSLRLFIAALIAFLIMLPFLGTGAVVTMNATFDRSAPVKFTVEALNVYTKGNRTQSYYVRVRSWRPDRETIDLKLNRHQYSSLSRLPIGSGRAYVEVTVHRGALGYEWYSSVGRQSHSVHGR